MKYILLILSLLNINYAVYANGGNDLLPNDVIEEIKAQISMGKYYGDNCSVELSLDDVFGQARLTFTIQKNEDLELSHNLEAEDKINMAEFYEDGFDLKFTEYPDDGYTGKDIIKVRYLKNVGIRLDIRDYGPFGILSNKTSLSCYFNK
jgi:hypothetical protein